MGRSSGTIFLPRASTSPCMPSRRGTENPQMSASRTPTVRPRRARATARFTVIELLPTPPLPEAMVSTRVVAGMSVAGADSRAFHRARSITARRSGSSMVPVLTSIAATPGNERTRASTSRRIWSRSGQPAMVRATSTSTDPSSATATARTIPRSTMLAPSSGSITPDRAWRTSSGLGGPSGAGTSSLPGSSVRGTSETGATREFYRRGPMVQPWLVTPWYRTGTRADTLWTTRTVQARGL
jgi:hypothetical protein